MYKFLCIAIISLVLFIPFAFADDVIINEGGAVFEDPIIEITTVPTKTPSPTQTPIIIVIEDAISTVYQIISDAGSVLSTQLQTDDTESILEPTTVRLKTSTYNSTIYKIVQLQPDMDISVSDDSKTVLQKSTVNTSEGMEIYYGYQESRSSPWSHRYKVESCDDTKCRVVRSDFATRKVWIEEITLAEANSITGIPNHDALPNGVKL